MLPAIQDATSQLKLKLIDLATNDTASPMHGLQAADCDVKNGRLISNFLKLVVPGIAPAPMPYNGQFVQLDVVGVTESK